MLNNGQTPSNYLNRVKQQSKKLYALNKKSQLDLSSLSKVQDVMAQINGYPNWYAFQTHLSNLIDVEKSYNVPQLYLNSIGEEISERIGVVCNEPTFNNFFNIVLGRPGAGKTTILKSMIKSNLFNRNVPIKSAILTVGEDCENLINSYNDKKNNSALSVDIKRKFINLFDLPLNVDNYSEDVSSSIFEALMYMTTNIDYSDVHIKLKPDLNLFALFHSVINDGKLVNSVNNLYVKGVLIDVDKALDKSPSPCLNWKDVTSYLYDNGEILLAKKSQQMASPKISDFLSIAKDLAVLEDQKEWLRKIDFFIRAYPFFNKEMNWIPDSYDFLCFNIDSFSSFKNSETSRFFVPFIIQKMLMDSYYDSSDISNHKGFAQFYIDEFDRYGLPVFADWAKNSKNRKIGLVVSLQDKKTIRKCFPAVEPSVALISQNDILDHINQDMSISSVNKDVLDCVDKRAWFLRLPSQKMNSVFFIPEI